MPQPDPLRPSRRQRAFFVYYKVEPSRAARLQQAFVGVVSTAAPWRAELMRRVEPADASAATGDGLQTWMEIYWLCEDGSDFATAPAPSGSAAQAAAQAWNSAQLRQTIEERARAAGILDLVHGERHYEAFDSCA